MDSELLTSKSPGSRDAVVVVKLGGSLITNKRCFRTLDTASLDRACSQLKEAMWRSSGRLRLVVIHGAGSFGHSEAKRFGLKTGGGPGHQQPARLGVAMTKASVRRLNCEVCDAMVRAGLPGVGISPSDCGVLTDHFGQAIAGHGSAERMLAQVRNALAEGCIPVLHGDVVEDLESRRSRSPCAVSILSGDLLVHTLVTQLGACAGITVSDVPGLLTAPPGTPGASLITRLAIATLPAEATSPGGDRAESGVGAAASCEHSPLPSTLRCVATIEASDKALPVTSVLQVAEPSARQGAIGGGSVVLGLTSTPAASTLAASSADTGRTDDVTGGMSGKVWELCKLALALHRQDATAEGAQVPCIMMVGLGTGEAAGDTPASHAARHSLRWACEAALSGDLTAIRGTVITVE
jgi:isopentenyl phosphate kinase